jgi:hypothetical protein
VTSHLIRDVNVPPGRVAGFRQHRMEDMRKGLSALERMVSSRNEKVPREPWPKPQPSRDSRPFGAGPGTRLRVESCHRPKPAARCDPEIADGPKTVLLVSEESLQVVRPANRRSLDDPEGSPSGPPAVPDALGFPMASGPRTVVTGVAFTPPDRRSGPAAGFPLRRAGQGRPGPRPWQTTYLFVFRDLCFHFREAGRAGLLNP